MGIGAKTKLTGLLGAPVAHSLSPVLHGEWLTRTGIDATYLAFDVKEGDLWRFVDAARVMQMRGFNVTMPYKEKIIEHLDAITPIASRISSVNCVLNVEGELIGDTTDGGGFVQGLRVFGGLDLRGKRVMVLGTGGAARAIVDSILGTAPKSLWLWGRTEKAVEAIVNRDTFVEAVDLGEAVLADVVINATSVGMAGREGESFGALDLDFREGQVVVDVVSSPAVTEFLGAAQAKGASTVGGRAMLVAQAALSFERWWDVVLPHSEWRRGEELLRFVP